MNEIPGWFMPLVAWAPEALQVLTWVVAQIAMIMLPLIIVVAMYTYAERKVLGAIQGRIGPNRVNLPIIGGLLKGWGQPFADVLKLLQKEIIVPTQSSRFLFILAPILALAPAFAAWAVMPLSPEFVLADINAGLLYILAMTSLGIYGIILAGWASNSKYAFLGAMRSAAQMIAYEIAMGFALVGVLMAAGSLNMGAIIDAQRGGPLSWFWLPLLPLFFVYFISGLAETNRLPFDMAEGESEIVAGFHVEYAGTSFAAFFLAEYANMILISGLTAVFFFGGWLSPFESWSLIADVPVLGLLTEHSFFWFAVKTGFFMFVFLWLRGTFPRYRYDQIMRLGWKVFIPVTLVWIAVEGIMAYFQIGPWSV